MEDDKRLSKKSFEENPLYRAKENPWDDIIKHNESWKKFTEKYAGVDEIKKNIISKDDEARKFLANLEKDSDYESRLSFRGPTFDFNEALENVLKEKENREFEELRRHNELVQVGEKQNQSLLRLLEDTERLLEDSKNSIEQRNAIIRFMVESMVDSDQSKEKKLKTLLEYSAQFATLAGGAKDVMQIINESIEKLN